MLEMYFHTYKIIIFYSVIYTRTGSILWCIKNIQCIIYRLIEGTYITYPVFSWSVAHPYFGGMWVHEWLWDLNSIIWLFFYVFVCIIVCTDYSIFNWSSLPIILIWIRTWNEHLKQHKYKLNSYNQYSFILFG